MGSTVAFSYDKASGALSEIHQISTLPDGFTGEDASAEIQLGRTGRQQD
jgi:6-phosphogluconolactonase